MDFTDYDVLSFDCYGTLIDWEAGITAVLGPWARRHQPDLTDQDVLVAYSGNEAEVEAAFADMVYSDVLQEAFRRTGAALGFEVTDAEAAALGSSVGDWPAFPDSAEALARLKQHCRLIILSNVHREGFAAASNRHLGVEFDAILTAQDIGSYKPNPANFDALLSKADEMGVPEGRLLHVAQSLFHDRVPAKAKGLPSVWINRRHDQPGWGRDAGSGCRRERRRGVTPRWRRLPTPSTLRSSTGRDRAGCRRGEAHARTLPGRVAHRCGAWRAATIGGRFEVLNPATGDVITSVADADDHADGNRHHAPEDRSEAPPAARSPNLERLCGRSIRAGSPVRAQ